MDEKTVTGRINGLYSKHKGLSRQYGYTKVECDKKEDRAVWGNSCEHASTEKAELESIERELDSLKLRLAQVQQQIIQVQSVAQ